MYSLFLLNNMEPILRKSVKNGLITEGAVGMSEFPIDAVTESINFKFDTLGSAKLRNGVTEVGTGLSGEVLGLYQFINSDGDKSQLVAASGTSVYYLPTYNNSLPAATLLDSYDAANTNGGYYVTTTTSIGQAFTMGASGAYCTSVKFNIYRTAFESEGKMTAFIKSVSGTVGTNARVTGDILSTSNSINIASLTIGIYQLVEFTFPDPIYLYANTSYAIYMNGGGTSFENTNILIGLDTTSSSHSGNTVYNSSYLPSYDTIFYLYGSVTGAPDNWTAIRTSLTEGSKARFSAMLDNLFMVNGTEDTAVWDGNTSGAFANTGNALNAPTGKFIENYRARMWIAGNSAYPDRLYYSSLPSAAATPVITWDTDVATGDWIDISPSDGENITALKRSGNALLVFKTNHLYQVFSIEQTDPDSKFNVGTYSQESVVEAKDGIYFHHPTGFYRYESGGVSDISKPIVDIVKGIRLTNYEDICGWVENDGDHICWAIGDLEYNGVSYSNMVVRYTISTQVWTHYQYPSQFLVSATYNDGNNLYKLVGDDSGQVLKYDTGDDDNGNSLFYSLITGWDNIDGLDSTDKTVSKIMFIGKGGTGGKITYQVRGDDVNDWTKGIGQVKHLNTGFNRELIKGDSLRFRIAGTASGGPIEFVGYEILKSDSEQIMFNE